MRINLILPMTDMIKFIPANERWKYIYSCYRLMEINLFLPKADDNKFMFANNCCE